jgi:LCP family protein required for cell wall assembly
MKEKGFAREQWEGRVEKGKKRQRRGRGIFLCSLIVLVILFLAAGTWLKAVWDEAYEFVLPGAADGRLNGSAAEGELESLPDIMNLLIFGLDSTDRVLRADTIMLLTLNRRNGEINIISIPRDMRVEIPGRGKDKINHSHAYGGVALTREVVENLLGVNVDYYMTADFAGFENVVDILGGIELDVEKRMYYRTSSFIIDLYPGPQRLDGEKALQYVRWRNDREGDLGRMQRQQRFLKILLDELVAFRNVLKFHRLVPELAQNIKTDLELSQAIMLANRLKSVDVTEINTFTLPGRVGSIQGVSYVLPEEEEIRQLVERYIKGNDVAQS